MKFLSLVFMLGGSYMIVQAIYFGVAMANGFVMTTDTFTDLCVLIGLTLVGVASVSFSLLREIIK